MEWQVIVALVVAIPVLIIPVAFVWFLNISDLYAYIKGAQKRQAARGKMSSGTLEAD